MQLGSVVFPVRNLTGCSGREVGEGSGNSFWDRKHPIARMRTLLWDIKLRTKNRLQYELISLEKSCQGLVCFCLRVDARCLYLLGVCARDWGMTGGGREKQGGTVDPPSEPAWVPSGWLAALLCSPHPSALYGVPDLLTLCCQLPGCQICAHSLIPIWHSLTLFSLRLGYSFVYFCSFNTESRQREHVWFTNKGQTPPPTFTVCYPTSNISSKTPLY